jgi:hypothetical protein
VYLSVHSGRRKAPGDLQRQERKTLRVRTVAAIVGIGLSLVGGAISEPIAPAQASAVSAKPKAQPRTATNNFYYGYWSSTGEPAGQNYACTGGSNYENLPGSGLIRSFANNCNVRAWLKGSNDANQCINPRTHGDVNGLFVSDIQITSDTALCPGTHVFTYGYWSSSGAAKVDYLPCTGGAQYTNLPSGPPPHFSGMRSWSNGCSVRVWVTSPNTGGSFCADPGYGWASEGLPVSKVQITSNTTLCPGVPVGA